MENLIAVLAEVLFRTGGSVPGKPFTEMSVPTQEKYVTWVKNLLIALDQINMTLMPTEELTRLKTVAGGWQQLDRVERVIAEFVKQLKHPKDVAKFFPSGELAKKILEG